MPQAKVVMNVRLVSPAISVIDIQGEVTAFAEQVMMQAYTRYLIMRGVHIVALVDCGKKKQKMHTLS